MSTATKPTRGWEKSATSQTRTAQSPLAQLTSFVDGLTDVERASHRAAYLQLLASMTGTNITVNLVDGKKLTGVLNTATPFEGRPHVVAVKAGRLLQGDNSPTSNGANDGKTAVVTFDSVTTIETNTKVELVSKNYTSEFQTDAAIKKHGDMSHLAGRNLQSVDSSWLEASGDMSLDAKGGKNWDQFEVNKRLFNVKDTYDENLYTKKLDLKNTSAAQIAQAERLAREIESQSSANIHLQEERGQVTQGDWDEEDRFSGVLREEERAAGGKKAAGKPAAEAGGAWTRGVRLGAGSGTASPATVGAGAGQQSTGSSKPGSKPLTPPPGVAMPAAGQATNQAQPSPKKGQSGSSAPSPATVPAGTSAAVPTDKATEDKKTAATDATASGKTSPKNAPTAEKATVEDSKVPTAESAPAASTAAGESTTAAKPAATGPVPKLRADAAEFKPSWMKDPAPPAAAPSTPSQPPVAHPPVNQFSPPTMYPNMPYGVPQMVPEGGPPQYIHGSPAPQGMVVGSPNMGGMPVPDMPPGQYFDPMQMGLPPGAQNFDPYGGGQQFMYAPGPGPVGQMQPMGVQMQMPMGMDFAPGMAPMPAHAMMMPYQPGPPPAMDFYGNGPQMMMGPQGQPMMVPYPGTGPGMYAPNMPGGQGMYPPHAMGSPGGYMSPNGNMGGPKMNGMRNTPNGKGGRGPGSGMKAPYSTPNRGMASGPNTPHTGGPQQHQQTRTGDSAAETGGP